jgi:hypothetical protein
MSYKAETIKATLVRISSTPSFPLAAGNDCLTKYRVFDSGIPVPG